MKMFTNSIVEYFITDSKNLSLLQYVFLEDLQVGAKSLAD